MNKEAVGSIIMLVAKAISEAIMIIFDRKTTDEKPIELERVTTAEIEQKNRKV